MSFIIHRSSFFHTGEQIRMRDGGIDDLMLGEDGDTDAADASLSLDAAALHDTLGRLRSATSLDALRSIIADLRRDLDGPASELRARDAQAVALGRSHLLQALDQVAGAQTLDRAHYYIDRLIRAVGDAKTSPINDINMHRWKEYEDIHTDSLWIIERRDRSGVHSAGYWGNFVPQIPHQMMRRYTKPGEWVLDVFAGSGTTAIEGQRLGRNTIGVELQERMVAHARQLIADEPNRHGVTTEVIPGDSAAIDFSALLATHGQRSAQLVIMHPPYFDIIKFSDDPRDLSNVPTVEAFLDLIGRVVDNVAPVLDRGRHLALVIGDKYAKGDWIPLGFQTMNEVMKRGFSLKSIVVKNFEETSGKRAQKELWRYRALLGGFYVFKHEYIFLFKKQ
jgi:DNA modification methylase